MKTEPRYIRLAATLRGAIRRGTHPVGSYLPTEHELCARYSVSRHTAREALRILLEDGLIERRRGAGTVVTQPPATPAFSQPLDSVEDLLQYAHDTRLSVQDVSVLKANDPLRASLRLPPRAPFVLISGMRVMTDHPPLASTRIAVSQELAPPTDTLQALDGAITEWIARTRGVDFDSIEQEISAGLLDEATARTLDAVAGSAALRTRRWYGLDAETVALASDTVHPADRFTYQMTLTRLTNSRRRA